MSSIADIGSGIRRGMTARTPEEIGAIVRRQRLLLGLDQGTLADEVGVTRQWLIQLEHGKAGARLGLVLRTLAALDLRLDLREKARSRKRA